MNQTNEIQRYLNDGVVSFSFKGIKAYTNDKGEIKKQPIHLPQWRNITKENCLEFNTGEALAIRTGEISDLTIIDFDNMTSYENFIKDYPIFKNVKKVKTNKGYHLYFKYNKNLASNKVDLLKGLYDGIDVRNDNGLIFAPPTKYKLPDGSVVEYIDEGGIIDTMPDIIQKLYDDVISKPIKKSALSACKIDQDFIEKDVRIKNPDVDLLLETGLLNQMAEGSWHDWFKVGQCMRWITTFEHFDQFSKINNSKYNELETRNLWDSIKEKYSTMNLYTLYGYAKIQDLDLYNNTFNLYIKIDVLAKGPSSIVSVIAPKLRKYLKYSNNTWYMFYEKTNLWMETKEPDHIIVQIIHKHILFSIEQETKSARGENDADTQKQHMDNIKTYTKYYSSVDSGQFCSQVKKHLKIVLYEPYFYLILDNNPYKIAFEDGIYNIETNTFTKGFGQNDFLTKTIPFKYKTPTEDEKQFVRDIIIKICNCNQSHMDYYLGALGQSLTGKAELEKALYFCVGVGGNNGKTLIFEALADIMPNYIDKIDKKTFEKGYAKAHKHLAGTKGKRIVYVEEMSPKEQDIEILKEIADGKTIKNEILYGTDETINVMYNLFFLANCQANLKVDGGIGNRYRQLCHNSKFNKETTEDDYEGLNFIQDRTLADKLKGDYKHALIQLLFDAGHKYTIEKKLTIPSEFQEAIENTLESNDEVKMWFLENCEYGEKFGCSKKELEEALAKPFKEIQSEIQRITNLKYNRQKKFGKIVGGYAGFRIKPECQIKITE